MSNMQCTNARYCCCIFESVKEVVMVRCCFSALAYAALLLVALGTLALGAAGLSVMFPPSLSRPYISGAAAFGAPFCNANYRVTKVVVADPISDCGDELSNTDEFDGNIVLMRRGGCSFAMKALAVQAHGAIGVIVQNSEVKDTIFEEREALFLMADDNANGYLVNIPVEMLTFSEAEKIRIAVEEDGKVVEAAMGTPIELQNYLA